MKITNLIISTLLIELYFTDKIITNLVATRPCLNGLHFQQVSTFDSEGLLAPFDKSGVI